MIEEIEPLAYQYGMLPNDFRNSTYKEINRYIKAKNEIEIEKVKREILILDSLGTKIIMGHPFIKSNKPIFLQDVFKKLFNESHEQTPEEMIMILRGWKNEGDE